MVNQQALERDGNHYCNWGVAAFVAGLAVLGVVFGPVAIHLGKEGAKRGATTYGAVVGTLGWIETIVTVLGILAMVAGS